MGRHRLEVCEWTVLDWKLSLYIEIVEGVTTLRNRIEFGRLVEWSNAVVRETDLYKYDI